MKILINEGLSTLGNLTGIGSVSYNLWKHLRKHTHCDITNFSYLGKLPRSIRRQIYIIITNYQNIFNHNYDIIHYLNYYTPKPLGKAKQVTTIHDLTPFLFPNTIPKIYSLYIKRAVIKSLTRNSAFIVPSYSIKNDLLSTFKFLDENKVYVCFNGVNDNYFIKSKENSSILNTNSLKLRYFLYVGTLEKRKNIKFLLETFIEATNKSIIRDDVNLILIGKLGFGYEEFSKLLNHPKIKWLNYVDNNDIIGFYKNSIALILPSLYEGFGITIAEAMVLGIPIIASNIPTNIEFNNRHNKQLFLFEKDKKEQLIDIIEYMDKNMELRSKLDYGDTSIYSYDRVVEEHLKIYKLILT